MKFKSNVIFSHFQRLQDLFQQLTIRQKIVCGYGLSLGIAVLGTTNGLIIGDRYFQSAREKMLLTNQQASILSSLQGEILEIQVHQQEIMAVFGQQKALEAANSEWQEHFQEMELLFSQLKELSQSTSDSDLQKLLQRYDSEIKLYFQNLEQLFEQVLLLSSQPQDIQTGQKLIWTFHQNQSTKNFYKYSHDLADLTHKIHKNQQQDELAYQQAIKIQNDIIIISILLSVIIATILALYTSKIIASPINTVTNIAKIVSEESNFELQAPITTKDEIGTLTNTLNQLIRQVNHLLQIQQQESQTQLLQSEKMSSLGRMLAGVAHEINNPINFISGNLEHIKTYIDDLFLLLKTYQEVITNPPEEVQIVAEEIDLEFIETDLPKILKSMEVGTQRTREIVNSLKNFSRSDQGKLHLVDLHPCIDSTLLILNNRLKNSVKVVRKYGDIPPISGYMALLYQVFMNIISNSIDALEEKHENNPEFSPEITITTECYDQDLVVVKIADNGSGISEENQQKIFETFFTTKPRGIGTGLGLAITHQIVVEKHQGKISCKSELSQGTEFAIALPINIEGENP